MRNTYFFAQGLVLAGGSIKAMQMTGVFARRCTGWGLTLKRGLELDLFTEDGVEGTPEGLDIGPPKQGVGSVGKPQGLHVLVAPHIIQHTAHSSKLGNSNQTTNRCSYNSQP